MSNILTSPVVFFALKVEKECTGIHSKQHSTAFERLSCAK